MQDDHSTAELPAEPAVAQEQPVAAKPAKTRKPRAPRKKKAKATEIMTDADLTQDAAAEEVIATEPTPETPLPETPPAALPVIEQPPERVQPTGISNIGQEVMVEESRELRGAKPRKSGRIALNINLGHDEHVYCFRLGNYRDKLAYRRPASDG